MEEVNFLLFSLPCGSLFVAGNNIINSYVQIKRRAAREDFVWCGTIGGGREK